MRPVSPTLVTNTLALSATSSHRSQQGALGNCYSVIFLDDLRSGFFPQILWITLGVKSKNAVKANKNVLF
jgi:hypothetical protein